MTRGAEAARRKERMRRYTLRLDRWVRVLGLGTLCLSAGPARAGTIAVTNTNDSGVGSLRAALSYANGSAGTTIQFHLPKPNPPDPNVNFDGKVYFFRPTSQLPAKPLA